MAADQITKITDEIARSVAAEIGSVTARGETRELLQATLDKIQAAIERFSAYAPGTETGIIGYDNDHKDEARQVARETGAITVDDATPGGAASFAESKFGCSTVSYGSGMPKRCLTIPTQASDGAEMRMLNPLLVALLLPLPLEGLTCQFNWSIKHGHGG